MYYNNAKRPLLYSSFDIYDLPTQSTKKSKPCYYANPSTDILESKNAYKAVVQLPGVAKENITINFEDNTLTVVTNNQAEKSKKVDGEVSEELEGKSEVTNTAQNEPKSDEFKTKIKQISTKPYRKDIEFPTKINPDNISANYSNGLLTLTLPKFIGQKRSISIL